MDHLLVSSFQPNTHSIVILLVDDQEIIGESIRSMLEKEKDFVFHFCVDPKQAIQKALIVRPTVILQDLIMPQIDGLTLVRYYRAHPQLKEIPLIVLSSKEDAAIKAKAFELGANDYLVKLPDPLELRARVYYHSKSYINSLERNEAFFALQQNQKALLAELKEAADYVKKLLPQPIDQENIYIDWVYIPSTSLGGDTFGYYWLDSDRLVIYLLDVCGHGVGAALLSVSVMNVLRSKTLPSTDFSNPAQVLTGLNAAFPMEKFNDMYFTMWYGVYDQKNHLLTYASGGHPPAILFTGKDRDSAATIRLQTPGFIIGGMDDSVFVNAQQKLDQFALLYLFSDGIYELDRPDQPMMLLDEFVPFLDKITKKEGKNLDKILSELRKQQNKDSFDDDFSLIEIHIKKNN